MDWLAIGSAALLIGMIVFMFPRMKHAVANSPKGTMQDWMGFIVPLAAVIGFIILLIQMV
ncbi:hypothetical protein MNBD_GAMMA09-703 [hydrothermal vent metagenome]|uniref:Uncharacterized protein n=1 Tax=hydrothermal vent metagenome TaxID=652676 RepID=A0A3B0YNT4_9ZZZZ